MRSLVVYYSMSGNVDAAARRVAARIGADLLRLEPVKAYPDAGFRKFFWGGKSALMGETPELVPYTFNAESYDLGVLGSPVWAGTIAPPLRTFVRAHAPELRGLGLAAFVCQSGSGGEKALEKLEKELVAPLREKLVLIDPKDRPDPATDAMIDAFGDALA